MTQVPPGQHAEVAAPGVPVGYLLAACMTGLVFLNLGLLAALLSPLAWLLHRWLAAASAPIAASHHRFLARTWIVTGVLHLLLYALLAVPLWQLLVLVQIALQASAADPGMGWIAPFDSLSAYIQGTGGMPLLMAAGVLLLHLGAALFIGLWLSVRLMRRWLIWVDRRPA
jgi:hypothetical protein